MTRRLFTLHLLLHLVIPQAYPAYVRAYQLSEFLRRPRLCFSGFVERGGLLLTSKSMLPRISGCTLLHTSSIRVAEKSHDRSKVVHYSTGHPSSVSSPSHPSSTLATRPLAHEQTSPTFLQSDAKTITRKAGMKPNAPFKGHTENAHSEFRRGVSLYQTREIAYRGNMPGNEEERKPQIRKFALESTSGGCGTRRSLEHPNRRSVLVQTRKAALTAKKPLFTRQQALLESSLRSAEEGGNGETHARVSSRTKRGPETGGRRTKQSSSVVFSEKSNKNRAFQAQTVVTNKSSPVFGEAYARGLREGSTHIPSGLRPITTPQLLHRCSGVQLKSKYFPLTPLASVETEYQTQLGSPTAMWTTRHKCSPSFLESFKSTKNSGSVSAMSVGGSTNSAGAEHGEENEEDESGDADESLMSRRDTSESEENERGTKDSAPHKLDQEESNVAGNEGEGKFHSENPGLGSSRSSESSTKEAGLQVTHGEKDTGGEAEEKEAEGGASDIAKKGESEHEEEKDRKKSTDAEPSTRVGQHLGEEKAEHDQTAEDLENLGESQTGDNESAGQQVKEVYETEKGPEAAEEEKERSEKGETSAKTSSATVHENEEFDMSESAQVSVREATEPEEPQTSEDSESTEGATKKESESTRVTQRSEVLIKQIAEPGKQRISPEEERFLAAITDPNKYLPQCGYARGLDACHSVGCSAVAKDSAKSRPLIGCTTSVKCEGCPPFASGVEASAKRCQYWQPSTEAHELVLANGVFYQSRSQLAPNEAKVIAIAWDRKSISGARYCAPDLKQLTTLYRRSGVNFPEYKDIIMRVAAVQLVFSLKGSPNSEVESVLNIVVTFPAAAARQPLSSTHRDMQPACMKDEARIGPVAFGSGGRDKLFAAG